MLNRKLNLYTAFICDLDGTLYYQPLLRICMAATLFQYYIAHFWRIKELLILRNYRKLHENSNDASQILAQKYNMDIERIEKIVKYWMIDKPLKYIWLFRDKQLLSFIQQQQSEGKTIVIYSDYPTTEKLQALRLAPNYAYHSGDAEINCLKPDTKGLLHIITTIGVPMQSIVFIGDRYDKDGKCAENVGIDYIILSKFLRDKNLYATI